MTHVTCPYCGVGCQVEVELVGERPIRIVADRGRRPNHGVLCQKGAYLDRVHRSHEGRALWPLLRRHKGEPLRRVSWEEALTYAAERLRCIRAESGPDALALYASGQLDTEAIYLFTKLFKGSLGCNHTDANSRLCMSAAVAAYKAAFGSDGPPPCYADIDAADLFLVVGANMAANHPVLFQRLRRRLSRGGARLVVLDPRRSETARRAHVHVQLQPGTDALFLQLVARRLLVWEAIDRRFLNDHTEGFERWRAELESLDAGAALAACGVHAGRVDEVAELVSTSTRFLSFYCQGVNQSSHGVANNLAIIHLHLLRGAIGRPGCGPFSLTGQPNAMGGREVGYLSNGLPGYRDVRNPEDRRTLEHAWGLPPGAIAPMPGRTATEIFADLARGRVRALWIVGTNPVVSMPDANAVRRALEAAEFLIVQDAYHPTETTRYADLVLPAAQWGEKTGTMTNSERLVQRSVAFRRPPGEARPDWWIVASVARAMGLPGFDHPDAEAVWDEYRQLTRGTRCDQSGMTNERLARGPLQWPCPNPRHPGTPRLYVKRRFATPSGRARFGSVTTAIAAEPASAERPLILLSGRILSQWHTRTRTGKIPELVQVEPHPYVVVHPDDAARLGVTKGEWLRLRSPRGEAELRVRCSPEVPPGVLFAPFHWGDLYHPLATVNNLSAPHVDPASGQPELKYVAVAARAIERAVSRCAPAEATDPARARA